MCKRRRTCSRDWIPFDIVSFATNLSTFDKIHTLLHFSTSKTYRVRFLFSFCSNQHFRSSFVNYEIPVSTSMANTYRGVWVESSHRVLNIVENRLINFTRMLKNFLYFLPKKFFHRLGIVRDVTVCISFFRHISPVIYTYAWNSFELMKKLHTTM